MLISILVTLTEKNNNILKVSENPKIWHEIIIWLYYLAIKFSNNINKVGAYIIHKWINLSHSYITYVRDVSIYEQCIVPLCLNHLIFLCKDYTPKPCCHASLQNFLTKYRYSYNYFMVIWRQMVGFSLTAWLHASYCELWAMKKVAERKAEGHLVGVVVKMQAVYERYGRLFICKLLLKG